MRQTCSPVIVDAVLVSLRGPRADNSCHQGCVPSAGVDDSGEFYTGSCAFRNLDCARAIDHALGCETGGGRSPDAVERRGSGASSGCREADPPSPGTGQSLLPASAVARESRDWTIANVVRAAMPE